MHEELKARLEALRSQYNRAQVRRTELQTDIDENARKAFSSPGLGLRRMNTIVANSDARGLAAEMRGDLKHFFAGIWIKDGVALRNLAKNVRDHVALTTQTNRLAMKAQALHSELETLETLRVPDHTLAPAPAAPEKPHAKALAARDAISAYRAEQNAGHGSGPGHDVVARLQERNAALDKLTILEIHDAKEALGPDYQDLLDIKQKRMMDNPPRTRSRQRKGWDVA